MRIKQGILYTSGENKEPKFTHFFWVAIRHLAQYIQVWPLQLFTILTVTIFFHCRAWQTASFPAQIVTFIRITGTRNSVNEVVFLILYFFFYLFLFLFIYFVSFQVFHCVHFECPASSSTTTQSHNSNSVSDNNNQNNSESTWRSWWYYDFLFWYDSILFWNIYRVILYSFRFYMTLSISFILLM